MWILLLGLTFGLVSPSWADFPQEVKLRSCSYAGVFLIEGNDRYSLKFSDAKAICDSLGTELANIEHLSKAYKMGMETCRYGWDDSRNITILRQEPNDVCAKNMTGLLSFVPTDETYDVYCYDSKDQSTGKNCTFEIRKPSSNVSDNVGDSERRDSNNNANFSTTVAPVELHSYSTVIDAIEKMKPNSSSFPHKHDKLEDTQPTTEPTTDESSDLPKLDLGDTEEMTTITATLDSLGSGMGEMTHTTISESTSEDPKIISEDHGTVEDNISETNAIEDDKRNTDDTDRKGRKIGGEKEKTEEEPGSDWLVILLVILAVLAIILVAALVLTRNRWCGRSQTLMITSKSSNEGNGAAASAASPQDQEREQEMVTLMNKEKVQENGNTEEFTVITLEESPEKNPQA
ncbi:CD44 antigen [Clarias gariepinus]|uniref:CD44 antigen n=1 Tax=Clarias gariepinus TaxID=13013 RepID=UPI00234E1508|nr:CD44 antigen [Clarias gariepinus]